MGAFDQRPVLVFWETTRACDLSCIHCRASAITEPLPGELSTEGGKRLIQQVASFGKPYPIMVFTGGDPLKRKDIFDLLKYATSFGLPSAVSPAVTPILTYDTLRKMKEVGVSAISVSLDGASAVTHEGVRRQAGTFERTVDTVRMAKEIGLRLQVNTTVMKNNYLELPRIYSLINSLGVRAWELFFVIKVGRGSTVEDLSPTECEAACNFLYDCSLRGMTIRTVEAPYIRRIAEQRRNDHEYDYSRDDLYLSLCNLTNVFEGRRDTLRVNDGRSSLARSGTLDGDGIIFVSYDGTFCPGGLLPFALGNQSSGNNLVDTYRNNGLLKMIRERRFSGPCGKCSFTTICGGSRARAYSYTGDPLASDCSCSYFQLQMAKSKVNRSKQT